MDSASKGDSLRATSVAAPDPKRRFSDGPSPQHSPSSRSHTSAFARVSARHATARLLGQKNWTPHRPITSTTECLREMTSPNVSTIPHSRSPLQLKFSVPAEARVAGHFDSADFMIPWLTTVHEKAWIPAFAGMTTGCHPRESGGPLVAASAIFKAGGLRSMRGFLTRFACS